VGLGNPGKAYASSRHNVGFLVVDHFAKEEGFSRGKKKLQVLSMEKKVGEETVMLLKPETFMNLSGPALREYLRYFGFKPERDGGHGGDSAEGGSSDADSAVDSPSGLNPGLEDQLLVVHDDLDLPEGKLRFRARGSSGGHRGVASIIEALGTGAFGRLKVGIGRPQLTGGAGGSDASGYVLEPLRGPAEETLSAIAREAARTLPIWIREGLEASASRFNGPCPKEKKSG
jgi:PTH1 family peptidyl-tRNA hydrolase